MLERLRVADFAVARSVEITPGPGLSVFTGETGAGKSLVVGALAFVFGARRGREVIASGAERATVEATVRSDEGLLTLERTISLSGRSSARIDGQPATLEQLAALAGRLVDIHGQSEQLAILRPSVQLLALDAYAGLDGLRQEVAALARGLREVRRQASALATGERERERLADQLRFEIEEIAAAAVVPGEDETLHAEHSRLANTERLREDVEAAIAALDAAPLGDATRAAVSIAARDPSAGAVADMAVLLETTAADLARALRQYHEALEEDPERLAAVAERLDRLARLRRKYGDSLDDVLAYADDAASRLARLTSAGESLAELEARQHTLLDALGERAEKLSRERRAAAGGLVGAIARELAHLGMAGAALAVGFACEDDPGGPVVTLPDYEVVAADSSSAGEGEAHPRAFTEAGVDRVELLASFNPGEVPRPLAAVASGGETSRFLLALTVVLGAAAEERLVVFDEVDEGVGGRAGALVGETLARLATRHQVLCVTHLPQVAAYGSRHFVVTKVTGGGRSWSEVREVAGEPRVAELAAMLGGASDAALRTARELLQAAAAATTR